MALAIDARAYRLVLGQALAGGFMGALPGSLIMAFWPQWIHPFFPSALLMSGCVLGAMVASLAATAGVFVDAVRAARRSTRGHSSDGRPEAPVLNLNQKSDEHPVMPSAVASTTSGSVR